MRILVFGAGVLGSVYAARLKHSGAAVTILARGQRHSEIQQHGLMITNEQTGEQLAVQPELIDTLAPDDHYDLIIVLVRRNQVVSTLPALAANQSPNILFMVNNAAGPGELITALGEQRVLLGFPGAGGARTGHLVRYNIVSGIIQKTTIGELDGRTTPRVSRIAASLRDAGFPTAISANMDAWLKTHVALISPVADAIYAAKGSNYQLARDPKTIRLMLRAIREGYQVLHELAIPITPAKLRIIEWLPDSLLVPLMQRGLATPWAETVIARHANVARDEMRVLADEFSVLAQRTNVATPALDRLSSAATAIGSA